MPHTRSLAGSLLALTLSVVGAACSESAAPASGSAGAGAGGASGTPSSNGGKSGASGANGMAGSSGGTIPGATGSAGNPSGGAASGGTAGSPGAGTGGSAAGGGSSSGGTAGTAGSGGSSGGAGGSGGGAAYNPCPTNSDPCKIMPLGDSITDGVGSSHNAGYRVELFRLSLMNQKKLTFVGSHESGPDMVDNTPFPKKQEGHSGWTIDDGGGRSGLYPQIQGWLTATPPHIITLMIGTNDIDIGLEVDKAPMRLGLLLDRIIMYAPDALIVLAQMVPTTDNAENQKVQAYNDAMPALVKARADAGKHIILVDQYGAFTKNTSFATAYMNDKLHPKDAGYVVMANTWWAAIGPLLK